MKIGFRGELTHFKVWVFGFGGTARTKFWFRAKFFLKSFCCIYTITNDYLKVFFRNSAGK
jgi:hypothetical protein